MPRHIPGGVLLEVGEGGDEGACVGDADLESDAGGARVVWGEVVG